LTILATDRSVSREARTVHPLSIGRKIGPAWIPAASNHSRNALAGASHVTTNQSEKVAAVAQILLAENISQKKN
jgi:hypothetical protein